MPLDKIMPDDMNEVACAMLLYINKEDRQAGAKMSYGDYGKHLAQIYGKHYVGSNPNDCWIDGTPAKIKITTSGGTKYELTWNKAAKFIHPYLKSTTVSETVETNTPTAVTDTPTDTAAFDYSAVDDDTADFLRKATERIARNVLTIMSSQAEIGAILIEARDRLANHYHGGFEKWYRSLGMSKSSVNRLIQVREFRENLLKSSQLGQLTDDPIELFDSLPKMLQSDISSPSAPAEAVNAVLSGDITTHKDYIALKKRIEELTEELDKADDWNEELTEERDKLKKDLERSESDARIVSTNYDKLREDYEELGDKNIALELELKEARSEARDVIITDPTESEEYKALAKKCDHLENELLAKPSPKVDHDEVDKRVTEAVDKMNHDYQMKFSEQRKELMRMTQEKNERIYELQDKIKELEQNQTLTGYFLPIGIEDYSEICKLLKGTKYADLFYNARLIKF